MKVVAASLEALAGPSQGLTRVITQDGGGERDHVVLLASDLGSQG
jgi:hypothetical protein